MVRVRVAALRARHVRLRPELPAAVDSTAVLHPANMSIPGTVLAFSVTPAFGDLRQSFGRFQAHLEPANRSAGTGRLDQP